MPAIRKPTVKVVPGQIWADLYSDGRTVRILSLTGIHATFEVASVPDGWPDAGANVIGRQDLVSYDEHGLRGYRLVSQPEGES